jgi:simple sugar transport system permease protein
VVGLGGAAFSLDIKLGWSDNHILGMGWIALAIVIFGGWRPIGGALGAILYGATKYIALLVGSQGVQRLIDMAPRRLRRPLARALRVSPPEALGVTDK